MKKSIVFFAGGCLAMSSLQAIKTHSLQKVQTTGAAVNEEAPKSWRSEEVKNYLGSQTVISHKQLTQTANQSLQEALQNVPGIHIRNTTGIGAIPKFSVRGFGGGGTGGSNTGLVLVNGIPVYAAPYADIIMAIFPVSFQSVDRISVIKGGESVQYGPNAFGGVINVITKPIPYKWENQVSERMTVWGRPRNGGIIGPASKNEPLNKTLSNNFLYDTYVRSGGMINKYIGVQAQANWTNGQGFRYNSPTNIQNYLLDLLYQINENNKITAYYQYYKLFITEPGSLSAQSYEQNRFQNDRPNNDRSGRAMRWGAVYQAFFGDPSKVGGDFTLTYYGHDISRDMQMDSNYLSVNEPNINPNLPSYTDQNYAGFFISNHTRRYVINGVEPNLNLTIATKSMKQTIKLGMRFMTSNLWFKTLQSNCHFQDGTCTMLPYVLVRTPSQNLQMANNYTAGYLSDKMEFFNGKLVFTPGLRYTFLNYTRMLPEKGDFSVWNTSKQHENEWSPALNVGYKPMKDWLFYFNYRRSFIPPQFRMVGIYSTNYNQIFNGVELGSRYAYKDLLSFNADYFVTFAQRYYAGGYSTDAVNARSQGVELELYYAPIRGLQFHVAYTYIDALITSSAGDILSYFKGIVNQSFNIKGKRLPYVSPNQFIFDMMYTYKKTTIGISSYFYSRAYSSILNQAKSETVCFHLNPAKSGGVNFGCNSVGLLPWYFVWNVQVSQVLWQSGRHKIVGSLQVNNIFNMKYYFRGIGTSPAGREPGPGRSVTMYLSYEF
ncbi:TonB-dependent receptor family protein [Helicobacter suis]|uniref:TonB-dependent receptor family protein n=1 Tax=Helicobacter suis TaxID=104628 RepID=UPI0013D18F64|nr:TonB-dependent receptor family protein [Helicobacter suis]